MLIARRKKHYFNVKTRNRELVLFYVVDTSLQQIFAACSVRTSSYGCTRRLLSSKGAQESPSDSSFLSAYQTSQVHQQLNVRTAVMFTISFITYHEDKISKLPAK